MKSQTEAEGVISTVLDESSGPQTQQGETKRRPLNVFYSYAHTDEEFRTGLDNHLSLLQRQGLISAWHDRKIGIGTEWKEQIDSHLRAADIVLLLVSADFLASNYCFDIELQCALAMHREGQARVIPVIVRPVDWSKAPFAELQALPRGGKAISAWSDRDEAFMSVAIAVGEIVREQAIREIDGGQPQGDGQRIPPGNRRRLGRLGRALSVSLPVAALSCLIWACVPRPPIGIVEDQLVTGKDLYRQKDYKGASKSFRRAAENGSPEAADYLGIIYEYGLGTQPDCNEGMRWFRKGANENSDAMNHIGLLFEHGCGVKVDNGEAMHWFEKAASFGSSEAMNNLGWMYANNLGVGTDYKKAMEYFRRAVDLRNADAMNNIGWMYQKGFGIPRPDQREANRCYKKAADAGSTLGMNSLGWVYEQGAGLPRPDYRQAMQWFRKAADVGRGLGSSWAMNNVGDMYEKGYAGSPNREEAINWYRKSAENGFSLAKLNLERLGIKLPDDRPCCPATTT
jgi:tetratricopeptide (TPR) repeat protein